MNKTHAPSQRALSSPQRRLVVLIGPPKTASTTLQDWLATHVHRERAPAFTDWDYPLFLGSPNGLFAYSKEKENLQQIQQIQQQFQSLAHSTKNIVVGSEALVSFQLIRNGTLFQAMEEWLNYTTLSPEIVIQYRSPRMSHLISMWKQQTQNAKKPTFHWSFQRWMCDRTNDFQLLKRLRRFTNSLGLSFTLVDPLGKYQLPTYLMDMSGIQHAHMDISHAFACQVMRVNCTSSYIQSQSGSEDIVYGQQWVQGLEGVTRVKNSRKGNANITTDVWSALEEILIQRDCDYYADLVHSPLLTVLYRHELWPNHCVNVLSTPHNHGLGWRDRVPAMLERMRTILSCPTPLPASNATSTTTKHTVKVTNISVAGDAMPTQQVSNATVDRHNQTRIRVAVVEPMTSWQQSGKGLGLMEWTGLLLLLVFVWGSRRWKRLQRTMPAQNEP